MTTCTTSLIADWQLSAEAGRRRANELGNCRAGLERFTEATTLETCAAEAAAVRDRIVASLRYRICAQVHQAHGEIAKYRAQYAYATAGEAARALEIILDELGEPGDGTLPRPQGTLPLHARAEAEARKFLGGSADRILGRCPVQ